MSPGEGGLAILSPPICPSHFSLSSFHRQHVFQRTIASCVAEAPPLGTCGPQPSRGREKSVFSGPSKHLAIAGENKTDRRLLGAC